MKTIAILSTLIAFFLLSCSKEEEAIEIAPLTAFPAPVVQVNAPETATVGETVAVTVHFLVKNGCGEFGSFEDSRNGNTITVKVYPHYQEGFCTQAITTREATYSFKPDKAGTYTLQFWAGEEQFITESIVVQ